MRTFTRAAMLVAALVFPRHAAPPIVELDHLWIMVSPGAPERAALERAGFVVWPAVQRHDGQGTASVMVELDHCFIELMWPDSSVRVTPDQEMAARKFLRRSQWRSSGWSPVGIGLRRTATAPDSLPFHTWPLTAAWRRPDDVARMITDGTDSTSPSVWVVARSAVADNGDAPEAARAHSNGARRITRLHLTIPRSAPESEALQVLRSSGVADVARGDAWLLVVTLDTGRQGRVEDLRPALPLIVKF
jgi:hypothetical protein